MSVPGRGIVGISGVCVRYISTPWAYLPHRYLPPRYTHSLAIPTPYNGVQVNKFEHFWGRVGDCTEGGSGPEPCTEDGARVRVGALYTGSPGTE